MDIRFEEALKLKGSNAFSVMLKPAGPVCNLNCTYCYYLEKKKLYPGKQDFKMSDTLLDSFTRQFIEAHQVPLVTFTWQGGEPTLLGLDFFRRALELQTKYAGGKTIENAFQTNGTRLNEDWCRLFSDNHMLVGISIDGPEHNHDHYRLTPAGRGSFKKAMHGIDLLHKYHVEFNTLSCVNSYNVHYAAETYKFLKQIGSRYMQFLPIVERRSGNQGKDTLTLVTHDFPNEAAVSEWSVNGRDYGKFLVTLFDEWIRNDVAKYFIQIFDTTLANWVGAMPGICVFAETCGNALVMEHNGDLFSCDHFVYPEYKLGNIVETPMTDMVRSIQQFDFGIDKRSTLPKYCVRCEYRFACHGECPKHRFGITPEGEKGLNYLCEGYKLFFHHVEPYMAFMARELQNKRPPANVMNWIRNRNNKVMRTSQPERNDPCPCGSGRKFKHCCMGKPLMWPGQ
jgi:uncharacterized protein